VNVSPPQAIWKVTSAPSFAASSAPRCWWRSEVGTAAVPRASNAEGLSVTSHWTVKHLSSSRYSGRSRSFLVMKLAQCHSQHRSVVQFWNELPCVREGTGCPAPSSRLNLNRALRGSPWLPWGRTSINDTSLVPSLE
jgi:hypothetical protein